MVILELGACDCRDWLDVKIKAVCLSRLIDFQYTGEAQTADFGIVFRVYWVLFSGFIINWLINISNWPLNA